MRPTPDPPHPPPGQAPAPAEVHIWWLPLDLSAPQVTALAALLSADEQDRAARFHFAAARQRFVVARGTLRTLLGRYRAAPPAALRFDYGPQGKPALTPDPVALP